MQPMLQTIFQTNRDWHCCSLILRSCSTRHINHLSYFDQPLSSLQWYNYNDYRRQNY